MTKYHVGPIASVNRSPLFDTEDEAAAWLDACRCPAANWKVWEVEA